MTMIGEEGERLTTLRFDEVELGRTVEQRFYLCNKGNSTLTIGGVMAPEGFRLSLGSGDSSVGPASGSISHGVCAYAWVSFLPTVPRSYGGQMNILSDRTDGDDSIEVTGTGIRPDIPRTVFEWGTYLVGIGVAPGRYYSDPKIERYETDYYCGWRRHSDRNFPDASTIGESVYRFDAGQAIVDILPTDYAFSSDIPCALWQSTPQKGLQPAITAGTWLVGRQVAPARYGADAQRGCVWERLRHFQGTPDGVIERGTTDKSMAVTVTISRNDIGFATNDACGTWNRVP